MDLTGKFLVDTGWLAEHLASPELRVFDCTTHLRPDPKTVYRVESGRADYLAGHIPGADFLDLQGELSDSGSRLRFTMPSADQFAAAMGAHGVGPDKAVVLYSATTPMWATRLWWMLRAFGFDNAAILDGGLRKWKAEGRPLSTEQTHHAPATFIARPRPALIAGREDVLSAVDGRVGACVLNALSAKQHAGADGAVHYGRPGRIKGSVNVPAMSLLREDGTFRPREELRTMFDGVGAATGRPVIAYCGGGIAATADAFALTMLGFDKVAVYDNSLSEWSVDKSLPMETD